MSWTWDTSRSIALKIRHFRELLSMISGNPFGGLAIRAARPVLSSARNFSTADFPRIPVTRQARHDDRDGSP
jgi:hypothetical protein